MTESNHHCRVQIPGVLPLDESLMSMLPCGSARAPVCVKSWTSTDGFGGHMPSLRGVLSSESVGTESNRHSRSGWVTAWLI